MARFDDITFSHAQVELERMRMYASQSLSPTIVQSMELQTQRDLLTDQLVYMLTAEVLGKRQRSASDEHHVVPIEMAVQVPASWWQAFKLAAIEAGNPFFHPDKVRMRTVYERKVVRVDITHESFVHWPDLPFVPPPSWGKYVRIALPPQIRWTADDA